MIDVWLRGGVVIAALMLALWPASLRRRDASIVDPFWGLGFVIAAWAYVLAADGVTPRSALVAGLVSLWGIRLFAFLTWRGRGAGEDYRYAAMRERWGASFRWVSLFTVFGLQGLLMWIISIPLAWSASSSATPWRSLDALGLLVFGIGFVFEAVGDRQLARFRADPANRGRVLDRGLWRYTRRPNYFGDALVWWGLSTLAFTAAGWWIVVSPVVMTVLLMRVSGVTLLEQRLRDVKPGYREYVRRTSAFVPWPPRRLPGVLLAVALGLAAVAPESASSARPAVPAGGDPPPVRLLVGPGVEESHAADRPINPASVVKLATTLWALDRLGPGHRFTTGFGYRGRIDRNGATLHGDLVVTGGADPDFHLENAWLVAEALNAAGVRRVTGDLVVDRATWIGWEGGSARRLPDPAARARLMATRLRDALEPARLDAAARRDLDAFLERRGRGDGRGVAVRIDGRARERRAGEEPAGELIRHRSNPLHRVLKRFNSYSNNDIERLSAVLGSPDEMGRFLARRWGAGDATLRFDTLSGLGTNRMSARTVVRLLDDLRRTTAGHGLDVADVMPVGGCDPGTLERYPRLAALTRDGRRVIAKTGTLTTTDGGVAVLAGYAGSPDAPLTFCVATPGVGRRVGAARATHDRWVAGRARALPSLPSPLACRSQPVVHSDHEARVELLARERPD